MHPWASDCLIMLLPPQELADASVPTNVGKYPVYRSALIGVYGTRAVSLMLHATHATCNLGNSKTRFGAET